MNWYENPWYYSPAKPIQVKGGIKSHTKRGDIGTQWWSKKWIDALTSIGKSDYSYDSNRLARGRSYARKGQVMDIKIEKGRVTAKVQGTRKTPYRIQIEITPIANDKWRRIAKIFSEKIYYAAKLVSGEMPRDMEDIFEKSGTHLFPKTKRHIKTDCSCPDWSNPCKHIAAVFYLLAEEFDRDPFLIFKMRGMDKEELMALVDKENDGLFSEMKIEESGKSPAGLNNRIRTGNLKPAKSGKTKSGKGEKDQKENRQRRNSQTVKTEIKSGNTQLPFSNGNNDSIITFLSADADTFWRGRPATQALAEKQDSPAGITFESPMNKTTLKRLGNFPFWRGNEPFLKSMEKIYENASEFTYPFRSP